MRMVVYHFDNAVTIPVSETMLVAEMISQVARILEITTLPLSVSDQGGKLLDTQQTVQEAGLRDGDAVFLNTRSDAGGMSAEQLMAWLSSLIEQAKSVPVDDLMKYIGWVVTSSKAVELIRRGASVVRQLIHKRPGKLEDVIKEIRSKPTWNPHELSARTGLSVKDAKGVLRLLGFCYNRRSRQYERVANP